jgi:hypothetical protein
MIPDDKRAEPRIPENSLGERQSLSSRTLRPAPGRPAPRHYSIRSDAVYSLREAAVLVGIAEGLLRRAVLLDHLPALEPDDDRQYLFTGKTLLSYVRRLRPDEEVLEEKGDPDLGAWALLVLVPILAAIVSLMAAGASSPRQSPPLPSPGAGIDLRVPDF